MFLIALLVSIGAVTSQPPPPQQYPEQYPGHSVFLDQAKAGWSWK